MYGRKRRSRIVENEIKILLADQDRVFLEMGKVYLRKTGTRVLSCNSGKEALEIIRDHRPDLVFMSSLLHDISGLECCSTVKADPALRGTPVALTLTAGNPENVETCHRAGCNEIVLKPIDRHTFFQIVTKYVDLEKRNAPRFKGKLPVHCSLPDGSSVVSEAYDISTGGLFLESERPLPASSVISVYFELPIPRTEISCTARVAWVNPPGFPTKPAIPPGMGIQLLDVRPEWSDAILEFIHTEYIVRMI
jgi:CheY-like chemotaxis protein/Tfp pilus assembly protein PilZ